VSEPLVIVGNGMAAARLVDEMTRCALARHTIAVIGDEPRGPKPGMVISRRAVSSFCAIFTIVRSSRAIASSRLRNCTTSGASASHTSNGIVSSQASISAASSRACLGPCGAITPTEFLSPRARKDRSRESAMAQRRLGPRPFRPSDGRPRRIYSLTAVNRGLMFLTLARTSISSWSSRCW
jgi:hypothetical protein